MMRIVRQVNGNLVFSDGNPLRDRLHDAAFFRRFELCPARKEISRLRYDLLAREPLNLQEVDFGLNFSP